MSRKKTPRQLLSKFRRENRGDQDKDFQEALNESDSMSSSSGFMLGIVEEVISDPYNFFNRLYPSSPQETIGGVDLTVGDVFSGRVKITDGGTELSSPFFNERMSDFVPANSVAVLLKDVETSASSNKSILCMPFFSSHLMMPVKPGETVWVMKQSRDVYYWLCRQTSFRQIEDLNFTHIQREVNIADDKLIDSEDEGLFSHFQGSTLSNSDSIYEKLMEDSVAYKEEFTGEVVPRNGKNCGDFLIQGSNNSHIYLGTEKFEDENTTLPEVMTNQTDSDTTLPRRKPISPAIDICILRKSREVFDIQDNIESNAGDEQSVETLEGESHAGLGNGLGAVIGDKRNTRFSYFENEKARDRLGKDIFTEEYRDSDIYNCIARIYMSNVKSIDSLLFTFDYPDESSAAPTDILGLGNYGALALVGANTRLVGAETVKIHNIVGSNGVHLTPSGDTIIFGSSGGGARIVLESGGDIRIVPGPEGIVKIGAVTEGDEDSMMIPVGAAPDLVIQDAIAGFVGTAQQMISTAGGFMITDNPLSTPGKPIYSTKVKIF